MKKSMLAAWVSLVLSPFALQAAEPIATLLVVPARQRMIQLAFDMQSLRNAEVVSWQAGRSPDTPDLNYWTGKAWDSITLAQFKSHSRLARKPQKVIFMGLDTPAVLTEAFPSGVARFETFDPAMLVNNLDAFYSFSNGEWRLLAKRYGFMLRDVNEKLRSQNRYTQPPPTEGGKAKRPPVLFEKNPPAAEVIELNEDAEAQAAAPEADKAEAPKTETITSEADRETEAELKPDVPAVESKPVESPDQK